MRPGFLFPLFWGVWVAAWLAAALWSAPATRRAPLRTEWPHRLITVIGVVLLIGPAGRWLDSPALWSVGRLGGDILAFLTIPGFLFTWWARLHLGRLWSGSITRKADHHIVDTGPYAVVRHPIYTGLLASCLVSAIAVGTLAALLGFAAITFGFWLKARQEERFLMQELGPLGYAAYRRRVPMLLPFRLIRPAY